MSNYIPINGRRTQIDGPLRLKNGEVPGDGREDFYSLYENGKLVETVTFHTLAASLKMQKALRLAFARLFVIDPQNPANEEVYLAIVNALAAAEGQE